MCLDFDPTVLPSSLPLARPSGCSQGKEVTNTLVGQGQGGWAAFEMHSWLWLDPPFFGSSKGLDPGTQA